MSSEREVGMSNEIAQEIETVKERSLRDLQEAYQRHFPDKKAIPNNRVYLWRRVAYKAQELEQGGLSAQAKAKLKSLADAYDPVNNVVLKPKEASSVFLSKRDRRLPLPGTIITKEYKGTKIQIKALNNGFQYSGKIYKSLTAVAKEVTGAHWNGFLFFDL
jgi:hypothetical protein